jgi:hypothetical protein
MKKLLFVLAMVMTYGLSVATAGNITEEGKKDKVKAATEVKATKTASTEAKADGCATVTAAAKADGCSGEKAEAKADGCSGSKAVTEAAGCSGEKTQAQAAGCADKANTAELKVE